MIFSFNDVTRWGISWVGGVTSCSLHRLPGNCSHNLWIYHFGEGDHIFKPPNWKPSSVLQLVHGHVHAPLHEPQAFSSLFQHWAHLSTPWTPWTQQRALELLVGRFGYLWTEPCPSFQASRYAKLTSCWLQPHVHKKRKSHIDLLI